MVKDDISNSQYIKPQVFVKISLKISCTPQIFLLYENDEYLGEGGGGGFQILYTFALAYFM